MTTQAPRPYSFSATAAASAGFALMWRHRAATLAWSVWMFLLILVGSAAGVGLVALAVAGNLRTIVQAETVEALDPALLTRVIAVAVPAVLVLFAVSWAVSAIVMAAATRMVLNPEEPSKPYLRFGADEWRMFLLSLVYGLIYIGGVVLVIGGGAVLWRVGWWAGLLFGLFASCALIWVSVRLSFAGPLTIAMRRFHLFGSWPLTRGRFWPVFGAYILAWLFLVVASIAAGMVGQVAGLGAFAAIGLDGGSDPGPVGITFAVIGLTIYLAAQIIYTVVQTVVLAATPAAIYREVGGSWQAEVF